jgi:hypothetical protein
MNLVEKVAHPCVIITMLFRIVVQEQGN